MESEILTQEQQSWAFIDDPSPSTAQPLCEAGVQVLWVDVARTEIRNWAPFADIQFQTDDSVIATLRPEVCPANLP